MANWQSGGMGLTTSPFGYSAGAGSTVSQQTSKSTAVTLNALAGEITLHSAVLAAGAIVSFNLNNSFIEPTDVLIVNHSIGGTPGAYTLEAAAWNGMAVIYVRNNTAGPLTEGFIIRFTVIKAAIT